MEVRKFVVRNGSRLLIIIGVIFFLLFCYLLLVWDFDPQYVKMQMEKTGEVEHLFTDTVRSVSKYKVLVSSLLSLLTGLYIKVNKDKLIN